jgi:DNA-binding MarR family transcriptional regulator
MNAHKQGEEPAGGAVLTPQNVRHAIRLIELLTSSEDHQNLEDGGAANHAAPDGSLLAVARLWYLVRQARTDHFSPAMFGEPAWDILLVLYLKEAGSAAPTISGVARAAGIPVTTAFRWLDYLDEKHLIVRQRSSDDARALTVSLSDEGRKRLERYFADVLVSMAATRSELASEG